MKQSIRLVSWDEGDAERRGRELREAGLPVDNSLFQPRGLVAQFKDVTAVCIDLDRLPSHGREVAVALRQSKATRHIPIVFAGGPKEKAEKIRRELPDATFVTWPRAAAALRKALKRPAVDPVRPPAHMERYASTPLVKKLGLRAGMEVALIGAPDGFEESLADVPEGVRFVTRLGPGTRLAMWFVRSRAELEREAGFLAPQLASGAAIWIASPKQSSKLKADFSQADVRAAGLAQGLVDYKVCAIDSDWSALKFTHPARPGAVKR